MKIFIIFAVLSIRFVFNTNFINATGFNESFSLRSGLATVNDGGFLLNMMQKTCGIYKIISPTKKIYIGKSANLPDRRQRYSQYRCKAQRKLYNSLMKHGWNKHKFEIICECSESELNELEIYYIKYYQSFNTKHGMNLREGGEGGRMSESTKKKLSIINKGKKASKETKQKLILLHLGKKFSKETKEKMRLSSPKYWLGKHLTESTKQKMSNAKKGKKHTEETKLKISLARKGMKCSEETKFKISLANKGKIQSLETLEKLSKSRKGKKRSLETRNKMSIAQKKAWILRKNINYDI